MPTWAFDALGRVTIKAKKDADPQVIGDSLQKISTANGGRLKPVHVVEAARPKTHVLHPYFEWRDKVAAEAYRLDQARGLIRAIVRVDEDAGWTAPAYVSIHEGGTSYREIVEVLDSPLLREQLLHQAKRDLLAFERRYQDFADLIEAVAPLKRWLDRRLGEDDRPTA